MSKQNRAPYVEPRIESVTTVQIVESLGPVAAGSGLTIDAPGRSDGGTHL
jgi:hypothetical protein